MDKVTRLVEVFLQLVTSAGGDGFVHLRFPTSVKVGETFVPVKTASGKELPALGMLLLQLPEFVNSLPGWVTARGRGVWTPGSTRAAKRDRNDGWDAVGSALRSAIGTDYTVGTRALKNGDIDFFVVKRGASTAQDVLDEMLG